jgi:hypothetical protein
MYTSLCIVYLIFVYKFYNKPLSIIYSYFLYYYKMSCTQCVGTCATDVLKELNSKYTPCTSDDESKLMSDLKSDQKTKCSFIPFIYAYVE